MSVNNSVALATPMRVKIESGTESTMYAGSRWIGSYLTQCRAENGSMGHGGWVKVVSKSERSPVTS